MTSPPAQGERSRWIERSVRNKLLAMALAPLLVVLPLLVAALLIWGNAAYDQLLITKVRSDLAVARGYFDQVRAEVGGGTESVAASHALLRALQAGDPTALRQLLTASRERLGLDFLDVAPADALPPALPAPRPQVPASPAWQVLAPAQFEQLAPQLRDRPQVPIVPTRNAAPSSRTVENRAMVMLASSAVTDDRGRVIAHLRGGILLNHNLPFIDHINRIVYPEGSLPLDSQGTATLFMDDVRITTNVRLFQDQRAIGTRVSQAVQRSRAATRRYLAGPRLRGR